MFLIKKGFRTDKFCQKFYGIADTDTHFTVGADQKSIIVVDGVQKIDVADAPPDSHLFGLIDKINFAVKL